MSEPSGDFSIGGHLWPGISKLIEEAGEVLQVCGKLMGSRGNPHHWDGNNLKLKLEEEIGDLQAAILFVTQENGLDQEAIKARTAKKLEMFQGWHAKEKAPPDGDVKELRNFVRWVADPDCPLPVDVPRGADPLTAVKMHAKSLMGKLRIHWKHE